MNHISIDLETLGKHAGCVVLAIGACRFDPITGETFDTFYANLDRERQEDVGLLVDPETEKWWSEQSEEARAKLLVDIEDPEDALKAFTEWCTKIETDLRLYNTKVDGAWGWGSNFDIVIIEALYRAFGLTHPWEYNAVECGRTICKRVDVKPVRDAGHHQAHVDAARQAEAIITAFKKLGLCKQGDLF